MEDHSSWRFASKRGEMVSSRFGTLRCLPISSTLRIHFHHSESQQVCEDEVKKCDPCQRYKHVRRGHGAPSSKEAPLLPWQDFAVDLIGPWTLSIGDQKFRFSAAPGWPGIQSPQT
jgi:hypothetical protein